MPFKVKSQATINREKRGIVDKKNPANVAQGILLMQRRKAKQALEAEQQKQADLNGLGDAQVSTELEKQATEPQINDNNEGVTHIVPIIMNKQNYQELIKLATIRIFQEHAEEVGNRLVDLAMGRNGFHDSSAAVQRLAMVDVLKMAGVSGEMAEKSAKNVHDMNKQELESFIASTKALIEKHEKNKDTVIIQQIP